MLVELLAVVCREDERPAGALPLGNVVPEPSELRVGQADLVVVERLEVPHARRRRCRHLVELEPIDLVTDDRPL